MYDSDVGGQSEYMYYGNIVWFRLNDIWFSGRIPNKFDFFNNADANLSMLDVSMFLFVV